jgi:hypothetical protein
MRLFITISSWFITISYPVLIGILFRLHRYLKSFAWKMVCFGFCLAFALRLVGIYLLYTQVISGPTEQQIPIWAQFMGSLVSDILFISLIVGFRILLKAYDDFDPRSRKRRLSKIG